MQTKNPPRKKNFVQRTIAALPIIGDDNPLVTVVSLEGVIGASGAPGRSSLSLASVKEALETAFKPDKVAAVAILVNSPGGSPVQSRLIFSEIRRLARENETPVLVFIEDIGASGGYIIAAAGDEIYADESSIVGSIGVVSGGFGFNRAIEKLGVERRVYTAGENKASLDPFKPENPGDIARLETMLAELHEQFIDLVKSRRGEKLSDDPDIFSGAFWSGAEAAKKGLIDDTAQFNEFIRTRFGKDVKIKPIPLEEGSWIKKLIFGAGAARGPMIDPETIVDAAQNRAIWARFGL